MLAGPLYFAWKNKIKGPVCKDGAIAKKREMTIKMRGVRGLMVAKKAKVDIEPADYFILYIGPRYFYKVGQKLAYKLGQRRCKNKTSETDS